MAKTVVIVGTQWGDEGKGKITDYLSSKANCVVRYQGGDNAGHTIEFNNEQFKLKLIPSGIFRSEKIFLGNGMVINPKELIKEMKYLNERHINTDHIRISNRAHVILPYHLELDALQEELKKDKRVGTTKKGIGPAYVDKFARTGIRIGEFIDKDLFREKLKQHLDEKNDIFKRYNKTLFEFEEVYHEYIQYAEIIKPYVTDTSYEIDKAILDNKKILFESAQGVMLDIDHGTYPYVTSSNPSAGAATIGAGIGPTKIDEVIGVVKAYSTRVGEGALPTELTDELGEYIRKVGREYGTVTGRSRRVGWFDGVIVSHTRRVSGLTGLSINLLDVLSKIETIKLCVAYNLDGNQINYIPATIKEFSRCIPIYVEMPGWNEDISQVKRYEDLPINARNYVKKIEEITNVPVVMISVGPDREQTIILKEIF